MPVLKRVQMGIQRVRSGRGPPSRSRLPITATVLERIRRHLESPNKPHRELLWAICCTAFFGFFRLGELLPECQLRSTPSSSVMWGDVAVDDRELPSMVRIHLKRSKCDQFGAGVDIVLGKTGLPLCPVSALLAYIEVRGSAPGRFFQRADSQPVLKSWFVQQLRGILAAVGLPKQLYAGHSFRIGAATTAALAGVEDSTIQALGRWHSGTFLQYIRLPNEHLASLSPILARHTSHNPPHT